MQGYGSDAAIIRFLTVRYAIAAAPNNLHPYSAPDRRDLRELIEHLFLRRLLTARPQNERRCVADPDVPCPKQNIPRAVDLSYS